MFYPKSYESSLSPELFKHPGSEYRGTPFWAWNGKLEKEELKRQIEIFQQMGFGGFHMHVRTGLETEYLSEEYMEDIRFCIEEAKKRGMIAYLYDEDRWPSGSCGGQVTMNHPEYARKSLLLTTKDYTKTDQMDEPEAGRGQELMRQENGELVAVYDIRLDEAGYLKGAYLVWQKTEAKEKTVLPPCPDDCVRWYAYVEHAGADPWFNNAAYVDTMNPEAVHRFIDSTHEKYAAAVGDEFGRGTKSIFTDEPQFTPKKPLDFAKEQKDLFIPWTDGLDELYRKQYGEDLWPILPEVFFEPKEPASVRLGLQNVITDRFVESFCRQIGDWCEAHDLLLTGHVMGEPTLESQTQAVGDAMRCYEPFGIPGIDMLCDFHEYTTAKQAASRVHQLGKEGMLSELYGVTGWDYDFRGYKLQGDWQAALGVTLRVPHLTWMTMHGEAKRDYPACIGYQSPWYEKYAIIEDHFARLAAVLTRGKPIVKVGVIHPIESFWLLWGPGDLTGEKRAQMEQQFASLAETLLLGTIDFDYIDEATLSDQSDGTGFAVGQMQYEVVIVPPVLTIRAQTVQRLAAFQKHGGRILWQGECPSLIEGKPEEDSDLSDMLHEVYQKAEKIGTDPGSVLKALEPVRQLDIRRENGMREDTLIYQLREDGQDRWLFIAKGKNPVSPDVEPAPKLRIRIRGLYQAEVYDTAIGETQPLSVKWEDGWTIFEKVWYMHDSMLLRLKETEYCTSGKSGTSASDVDFANFIPDVRFGMVPVELEEPNMLLLDIAEYCVDGEHFELEEEILRIDNLARAKLGIPLRKKEVQQPYTIREVAGVQNPRLKLRFRFVSKLSINGAKLALEDSETARIWLNGKEVKAEPDGWFVDRCIRTIPLPEIVRGENRIEVEVPIGARTNLEAMYLLGDFGVKVSGTEKVLTEPVKKIGFGDITPQGLPFYTGNLLYHMQVAIPDKDAEPHGASATNGEICIRIPQYRGGLCEVMLDGKAVGEVVYSPYTLKIPASTGEHELTVKLYGTRQNGFAQLHHTQGVYFYQSPNSWRSDGDLWTYEYQFKKAGILKSPELYGAYYIQEDGTLRTAGSGFRIREHS
ncbi:MAG: hypothetical protein IKG51_04250 [Firmicutes bacterium]|nr:hypothetical protein [Bacillota bacterium]